MPCLRKQRSARNLIAAYYAAWNAYSPQVRNTFKRIKELAIKTRNAEYEGIRKITMEIQLELDAIRLKLAECALGSPEETKRFSATSHKGARRYSQANFPTG